jgi:hypothetical protein
MYAQLGHLPELTIVEVKEHACCPPLLPSRRGIRREEVRLEDEADSAHVDPSLFGIILTEGDYCPLSASSYPPMSGMEACLPKKESIH